MFLLAGVAGCAGPSDGNPSPDAARTLTGLQLAPNNPSIARGTTQRFTATGTFSDGSTQDVSSQASWSVLDVAPAQGVATIDNMGVASGVAVGQASVLAGFMGKTAMTSLVVTPATLTALALTPSNPSIAKGTSQQFTATGTFSDNSTQDLSSMATWSAADILPAANVATVDHSGLASGNSVRQATITATVMGTTASTRLTVVAATLTSLALAPSNPSIAKGTSQQFTATGIFSDGSMQDLSSTATWSSADIAPATNVAAISTSGLATAHSVGQVHITASILGKIASTTLTVTKAVLTSLALTPSSPSIANGTTQRFTATGTFSDGSTQDVSSTVTWSATDVAPATNVASISTSGVATARNVGQATITATLAGKSAATTLTVTPATLMALGLTPLNPSIARATTQQFTATGSFTDGSMQDVTTMATWSTTDVAPATNVASISSGGLATAQSIGHALVTATLMGKMVTTTLAVTAPPLTGVTITPSSLSIAKGATQQFLATATFMDGSTQDVTISSSWGTMDVAPATNVATINVTGLATAISLGQASVTATFLGKTGTTTMTVTAPAATTLALTPVNPSIAKGATQQFTATATMTDGSMQDVTTTATWSTTDIAPATNVAIVSSGGLATGKNVGLASITAKVMGITGTTTLSITPPTLNALTLQPGTPALKTGSTQQFTALGVYSDGSMQDLTTKVTWSAADVAPAAGVASITTGGLVTANNPGHASITAEYMGLIGSTVLAVYMPATVCSTDKWCWRNPLPQGNALYGVWGSDTSNLWAVGANGTIIKWDGSTWSAQNSGTIAQLNHVFTVDASHGWAVGDSGTILKWDGSSWTAQTSGTTQDLLSVWGTDATHLWAVGAAGTVLYYDGSAWTTQSSGTTQDLLAIWGSDATHLWVSGNAGVIQYWNGSMWSAQSSFTTKPLRSLWGADATHVWAAGDSGTIVEWDGSSWGTQTSGVSDGFLSLWGSDSTHVFATSVRGIILKWDGTGWKPIAAALLQARMAVWASDASDIFAVGSDSVINKWNGTAWSNLSSSATRADLSGVYGLDASNVWATGTDNTFGRAATIVKWDGNIWQEQTIFGAGSFTLNAIWAADPSNVWAVGYGGTIVHGGLGTFSSVDSGTGVSLSAIWGKDTGNVWAVGDGGTILKWDGSAWKAQSSGTTNTLSGLWGVDVSNVWVVGASGTILKWDGGAWRHSSSGTTTYLYAVFAADVNNVWAVGDAGTILKWDGSAWKAQSSGTTVGLYAVSGRDATHVWAVGYNGTILKWDGSTWSPQSSGTTATLLGISAVEANHLWTVGNNATILEHAP